MVLGVRPLGGNRRREETGGRTERAGGRAASVGEIGIGTRRAAGEAAPKPSVLPCGPSVTRSLFCPSVGPYGGAQGSSLQLPMEARHNTATQRAPPVHTSSAFIGVSHMQEPK